ncbi:MAG: hypothetical protein JWP34_5057 [Massilia sp.]|jgi:hypothetical protein|nr:hypothetical protein [Massilia sp.]
MSRDFCFETCQKGGKTKYIGEIPQVARLQPFEAASPSLARAPVAFFSALPSSFPAATSQPFAKSGSLC